MITIKVIIPLAGLGKRLRPHTYSKPKPLMYIAGNTVLGHILDQLKSYNVEEIIFIVGYLGEQIRDYVDANYKFKSVFIEQKELKGQAHAVKLAEKHVGGSDVLIWFVDTISDADLNELKKVKSDGLLYVKSVEDPRRFGVVVVGKDGYVTQLIEKPEDPISNLVNIGLYYIRNSKMLFECIDELIKKDMQTKGEFYLMDAFQLMIKRGAKIEANTVNVWKDCGKLKEVLDTNRYLLDAGHTQEVPAENSILIQPVHIDKSAIVKNSIIGPYVSIGPNAKVDNIIARNSIIGSSSVVKRIKIEGSLIGNESEVTGVFHHLDIGDSSRIVILPDMESPDRN